MAFAGLRDPGGLRTVKRAHVIAWRRQMTQRHLKPASIRRKLSSLSEHFDFLTEQDAVDANPVDGVKRPAEGANEGKTPCPVRCPSQATSPSTAVNNPERQT